MKKIHPIRFCLCLLVCCLFCLILSGCGGGAESQPSTAAVAETEPAYYTVQFFLGNQAVSVQQVAEGAYPVIPDEEFAGWILDGWLDGEGQPAEPDRIPVHDSMVYTALVFPDLSTHNPYLFADEAGNIRPDDPLTAEDLKAALEALALRSETLEGLSLPESGTELTAERLRETLAGCFSQEMLDSAFAGMEEGVVSRSQFAQRMNLLLNRGGQECVLLEAAAVLPKDLALNREDCVQILEACLSHTQGDEGLPIQDAVLNLSWAPGFTNHCGWLYYADENGSLLRNGQLGTLTFGEDGRYTSGDPELDAIVADLVEGFWAENPEAERLEVLRAAFNYCRDSFQYLQKPFLDYGTTGWEAEIAKKMLTEKVGNCYYYAAAFWALARGLGYEAQGISGHAFVDAQPHSWVELEIYGSIYISDPQQAALEAQHLRSFWGLDMFMIAKNDWWMLRYAHP